jgi:hypothetical protein
MKRTLIAVSALTTFAGAVTAQENATLEEDRAAIEGAARDYMEGALNAAPDRMARAVHPGLTKVVIARNRDTGRQYLSYNTATLLVEWVRSAGERVANIDKNVEVTVLDIDNRLATARAVGAVWYDFLQLAKIDGEWRIVNILWAPNRPNDPNRSEAEEEVRLVPTARDSAQVVAQALNYIQGSFTGDAGRMESALHPELTKVMLAYDRTTQRPYLRTMGTSDLVEGTLAGLGMVPEDEWHIDVDIQDVSHGIASVKVTSSMYIDYLQMGKVNGAWKIINVLWVPNPEMQQLRPSMRR